MTVCGFAKTRDGGALIWAVAKAIAIASRFRRRWSSWAFRNRGYAEFRPAIST